MTRTPYKGTSRKLALAFDIGTTYSGAAYAFLDPGEIPQIKPVTKQVNLLPNCPTNVTNGEQIPGQPKRWDSKGPFDRVL